MCSGQDNNLAVGRIAFAGGGMVVADQPRGFPGSKLALIGRAPGAGVRVHQPPFRYLAAGFADRLELFRFIIRQGNFHAEEPVDEIGDGAAAAKTGG